MLACKVQTSTPLWLWSACAAGVLACSACSADSESLHDRVPDPLPTTFALENHLSQSIWVRVVPGDPVHFTSVTDTTGGFVRRFRGATRSARRCRLRRA